MAVTLGIGRFLFTATLPDIMLQLSLSTQTAGLIASSNYLGYFLGACFAIIVPKRRTWHWLMTALILSALTTLSLALPLTLPQWYIARLLSGIASSVGMILGSTYLFRYFTHDNRWMLSTIHYTGIGFGIVVSALVTWQIFVLGYHFDVVWAVCGISCLPLLYFIWRLHPVPLFRAERFQSKTLKTVLSSRLSSRLSKKISGKLPETPSKASSKTVSPDASEKSLTSEAIGKNNLSNSLIKTIGRWWQSVAGQHSKTIALVCISYLLAGFGYVTSATFLPLMATAALSQQVYSGLFIWLVVGVFTTFANPLWGIVAKRFGADVTLLGLLLLQTLGMFLPIGLTGDLAVIGLYGNAILLGLTFIGIVSLTLMLLKDINPDYANMLVGLATVMYSIGQFVGPIVTVAVAGELGGFTGGLMAATMALAMASGLMLIVVLNKRSGQS